MLYKSYQAFTDLMLPSRMLASAMVELGERLPDEISDNDLVKRYFALCEVFAGITLTHKRPDYGIEEVLCGNEVQPVVEEVAQDWPFGNLLHFAKPGLQTPQPRMLVVAPLSGHFATLLRNTVETLLRDHDVYILDWKNARDIPQSEGRFGFDDYVDYIITGMQHLGPGSHMFAVCQPCVPALVATALMAEDRDPSEPRTLTLLGGPVDTRESPTVVNELANSKPYSWFEETVIDKVPLRYRGRGRKVYPGFLQLTAFMSMNPDRHWDQQRKLYDMVVNGEDEAALKIQDFYKEYFAVLDLTAEFYLETIDKVFQRALLAKGELMYRGERLVDCNAIQRTAILTVEGERDDICAVGQTAATHLLCGRLRPHLKRHYLQPGVGHYGIFAGSKWERQVYPQVRNIVLAMN
ncbi:polyhydroxyalkanoate depolymerase [Croceicoccus mobilis]|uniref:Poly(3-hydroxybutyrate) depolymerase n=1 Tax=Croceicoccus mobilis TaxID=1703339 RepID=A0A916YXA2_9SPHN|nr:polyhydroxyalkanoate depolymerase [Croceicoccus mobilis]GGD65707.1 poly(3-hydroxybutyrate) depolymerase [Croceicoccus mobilis]